MRFSSTAVAPALTHLIIQTLLSRLAMASSLGKPAKAARAAPAEAMPEQSARGVLGGNGGTIKVNAAGAITKSVGYVANGGLGGTQWGMGGKFRPRAP